MVQQSKESSMKRFLVCLLVSLFASATYAQPAGFISQHIMYAAGDMNREWYDAGDGLAYEATAEVENNFPSYIYMELIVSILKPGADGTFEYPTSYGGVFALDTQAEWVPPNDGMIFFAFAGPQNTPIPPLLHYYPHAKLWWHNSDPSYNNGVGWYTMHPDLWPGPFWANSSGMPPEELRLRLKGSTRLLPAFMRRRNSPVQAPKPPIIPDPTLRLHPAYLSVLRNTRGIQADLEMTPDQVKRLGEAYRANIENMHAALEVYGKLPREKQVKETYEKIKEDNLKLQKVLVTALLTPEQMKKLEDVIKGK